MHAADAYHPNQKLQEKLEAILALPGGPSIDLTIRESYLDLLTSLGNPHRHLPPVIHVAGTNGKGSVIAMLRSIFEVSGYKAHVYTSPHLLRFNERIVLAGQEIDDAYLEMLLDKVMSENKGKDLTFFEITTALAFYAFAQQKADICLLETGLGGLLDSTNVIQSPLATVITHIGYDHMEFLGESLFEIAAEKAGIMKPGVPCILAPQTGSEIDAVFAAKSEKIDCDLIKVVASKVPLSNMIGSHQLENEAVAICCAKNIRDFSFDDDLIARGLQNAVWPGRLQQITRSSPFAALLPQDWELWIDGGHNESAAKALAAQARVWEAEDGRPLHLIIGMMPHKDQETFLSILKPVATSIELVEVSDQSAIRAALRHIAAHYDADVPGRVLCAGSLYMMGMFIHKDVNSQI